MFEETQTPNLAINMRIKAFQVYDDLYKESISNTFKIIKECAEMSSSLGKCYMGLTLHLLHHEKLESMSAEYKKIYINDVRKWCLGNGFRIEKCCITTITDDTVEIGFHLYW